MGRPRKGDEIAILQRREKVAKLYAAHERPVAIAKALGMKLDIVRHDLKAIKKSYNKYAGQAFAVHIAQDLATMDEVIRRAMTDYVNTKDPRLLQAILTAVKTKADILGYRAPVKIAPTTPDGLSAYTPLGELTDSDLWKLAQDILEGRHVPQIGEGEVVDGTVTISYDGGDVSVEDGQPSDLQGDQ